MQSHKEMFEAILAGEILISIYNQEYKLIEGELCVKHPNEDTWSIYSYGFPHYENVEIKKRTINVNGFEVPEPERKPLKLNQTYYITDLTELCQSDFTWEDDFYDNKWLKAGMIHLSQENAILHANALLSFTKKEEE